MDKTYGVSDTVVAKRMTAVGLVVSGAVKLHWLSMNPSAGNSVTELTDDIDGSTAIVFDHFDTARDGHMMSFLPPFPFTRGVYLLTFDNMTSITFGYSVV